MLLQKEGKNLPGQSLLFMKQGGVMGDQQYNKVIRQKTQLSKSSLLPAGVALLVKKFRADVREYKKRSYSLLPSSSFMTKMFMFGLSTNRYDNPSLNFWGDFRKKEIVNAEQPIRYRGFYKQGTIKDMQQIHVFEVYSNKSENLILVYSENGQDVSMTPKLTPFLFSIYKSQQDASLLERALALNLQEAFPVSPQ